MSETLECPICHKQFKYNPDIHKYKLGKEYTCSWKCLLKYIKKDNKHTSDIKKRGRPRKNEVV